MNNICFNFLQAIDAYKINKLIFFHLTRKESKVRLHQSSILFERSSFGDDAGGGNGQRSASNQASLKKLPTDWLIFDEMTRYLLQVRLG
jgi:hypothetical protein